MFSTLNGHRKLSGKVSPTDTETIENHTGQQIHNIYVRTSEDPVQSTTARKKESYVTRVSRKDTKGKEAEQKKKPEGPTLKPFEIVYFFFLQSFDIESHFFSINLLTNGMFF